METRLIVIDILLWYACGSGSLTRDRAWAPCIGSTESYPLDHQESPYNWFKVLKQTSVNTIQLKIIRITLVGEQGEILPVAERETTRPGTWGILVRGCSKDLLTGFALVLGDFDVSSWKWRFALGWMLCSCRKQG